VLTAGLAPRRGGNLVVRTIKKYPNRRLYDTERSKYITLADVRDLVMEGIDFEVVDANSGDDITRSILLQIIMEKEANGEPLFTTDMLTKFIRFYGDTTQQMFSRYMEQSMSLFLEQQRVLQDRFRNAVTSNPMDLMSDLTRRNLEIWQDMQKSFLKAAGFSQFEPDNNEDK
jgi:polyhydroxyalkanoate synthesis repressor PhaR